MNEADRIARAYKDLEASGPDRWSPANPGNQAILAERRRRTRLLLGSVAGRRVLEVGSGRGGELAWLMELGAEPAQLTGVDLLEDRVAAARVAHPGLDFRVGNAEHLEFEDASFDLVMAITVFSSILDPAMAGNVAAEVVRVMKPGGALLWYDFRYDNPSNRDVRGVSAAAVWRLFPDLKGELTGLTLLPPLARGLGPLTSAAYPVLSKVPPLQSHLLGLLHKG